MSKSTAKGKLTDGSDGLVINGIDVRDQSGSSVSGAGDINGDRGATISGG